MPIRFYLKNLAHSSNPPSTAHRHFQCRQGKQNRTFVVILAPVVQIPIELSKLFVVVEHELPNREQLAEIVRGVATEPGEVPEESFEAVLDSAAGLTRYEAENAFALSLVRYPRIEPAVVFEQKSQMLKKSGLLSLHQGTETFADLGGLEALKSFCLRSLRQETRRSPQTSPRGVLLLSPPGCGKSAFAKSLGNETGRPTLVLDVGGLLGSLVGQSEQNIRQALRIADAMAPCVLFCDELEKALSGANGQGDSGVSSRLFGTLSETGRPVGACRPTSRAFTVTARPGQPDRVGGSAAIHPTIEASVAVMEHQLDELGDHFPDECEECLLSKVVACKCRCGRCCELLIIEVSLHDAEREPLIAERASPIYDDMSGVKEQIGWLLNGEGGPCVFFDRQTRLCTIHETRPLVCRLYNCDESELSGGFANE